MRDRGCANDQRRDASIRGSRIPTFQLGARPSGGDPGNSLAPQAETFDQGLIPRRIVSREVVEQATSLAHQLHQPAPGMVILEVGLEVLGELSDALRQDGDLNLGRAGIAFVLSKLRDELLPLLGRDQGRNLLDDASRR